MVTQPTPNCRHTCCAPVGLLPRLVLHWSSPHPHPPLPQKVTRGYIARDRGAPLKLGGISITGPLETSGSQVNSETISCKPHRRSSWGTLKNLTLLWLALLRFSRIPGSRSLNLEWLTLSGQTSELGGRLTESSGFHERPRLSFGKRQ